MSKRSKTRKKTAASPPTGPVASSSKKAYGQLAILALSWLIAWVVYFNTIPGEFVYDDTTQIVENSYVQDGRHIWRALTSDVWAFKGEREQAWSNYWRPMFVVWLMVNFRLFGLEPAGWHVANILLHCVVLAVSSRVLRQLKVRPAAAACTLWIFAAHPVHTESVAWISGSPDMVLTIFLLGSYSVYLSQRTGTRRLPHLAMLLLFAGATLSKEVSILFPALVFLTEWTLLGEDKVGTWRNNRNRLKRSLLVSLPFVAVAMVYLILRANVLGTLGRATPWAPSAASMILSVPAVLTFYLRQAFWPMTLGPAYPLRAVEPVTMGMLNLFLPCVLVLLCIAAAWIVWRRGVIYRVGLALFLLPLAPAMNISAFLPEQIVHDRYLYLPLLGLLMIVTSAVVALACRLRPRSETSVARALCGAGLLLSIGLAVLTVRYNRAWLDETSLWECGLRVDPNSTQTLSRIGSIRLLEGRTAEARQALARALEINPGVTSAILGMAKIDRLEGRYADAEARSREVLAVFPEYMAAWDHLGTTMEVQGKLAEAVVVFTNARKRIPYHRVKYTMNIAILHKRMGDDERAIAELESIRDQLLRITDPDYLRSYYFLGELYTEAGRTEEARSAYEQFLRTTTGVSSVQIRSLRQKANARLGTGK